jgi:hypothetical protein
MNYRTVKGNEDWVRDMSTGLLVNTNKKKLNQYKLEHTRNETVRGLENDINTIKTELSELKTILKEISERL